MTESSSQKEHPRGQPDPKSPDHAAFAGQVFISLLITGGVVLVFLVLWTMSDIFLLIFGAVLVTLFVRSLSGRLKEMTKLNDPLAVVVVILMLAGGSFLCIQFLTPHVAAQVRELSTKLPEAIGHLQEKIRAESLDGEIWDRMLNLSETLKENTLILEVKSLFSVTLGVMTDMVIFLFFCLYLCF